MFLQRNWIRCCVTHKKQTVCFLSLTAGKKAAKTEDAELDALMEELNQPAKPAEGKKKKKGKGGKGGCDLLMVGVAGALINSSWRAIACLLNTK